MQHALAGLRPRLAIHNSTRTCPTHGEYPTPLVVDAEGKERGGGCPKCREIAQRDEWHATMHGRHPSGTLVAEGIPSRFTSAQLSTFRTRNDGQKTALCRAQEFIDHFSLRLKDGGCITLLGMTGTGKTRLACSIANTLAPAGYKVRYTKMYDMIDHIRESWGASARQTTRAAIAEYVGLDLLIIDELAVSKATSDNEKILLFRVIDGRYEECRPTILISNQDLMSFGAAVGDRVIDRLVERGQMVVFDWPSERPIEIEEPPQAQLSLVAAK